MGVITIPAPALEIEILRGARLFPGIGICNRCLCRVACRQPFMRHGFTLGGFTGEQPEGNCGKSKGIPPVALALEVTVRVVDLLRWGIKQGLRAGGHAHPGHLAHRKVSEVNVAIVLEENIAGLDVTMGDFTPVHFPECSSEFFDQRPSVRSRVVGEMILQAPDGNGGIFLIHVGKHGHDHAAASLLGFPPCDGNDRSRVATVFQTPDDGLNEVAVDRNGIEHPDSIPLDAGKRRLTSLDNPGNKNRTTGALADGTEQFHSLYFGLHHKNTM